MELRNNILYSVPSKTAFRLFLFLLLIQTADACPALAFQADSTASGSISVSAAIDKTEVPRNQQVVLTVVLFWEGRADRYRISDFQNPALTNFELAGSASSSRSEVKEGSVFTYKDYIFNLSPAELGMAYIDGITISYTDNISAVSGQLTTRRLGVKVTAPEYPADYSWIGKTLGVLLIFGALAGAVLIVRKKRARKETGEPAPQRSPEEIYLEQLKELKTGKYNTYGTQLDEVVGLFKNYLIDRFEISPSQRSDQAIKEKISQAGVGEAFTQKTLQLFDRAEELRFSGTGITLEQFEPVFGSVESCISMMRGTQKSE
ncbi:hypothetical protein ACFL5L_00070 [candidate division KSB1 bacterium]